MSGLTLVSHALCPYVQRAAIVLAEKGAAFDRVDVDLAAKPAWFLRLSPLGKTPVLQVGGQALFESAVICEYLDETLPPRLHPAEPLARARERAWMAFGSTVLDGIARLYNAADDEARHRGSASSRSRRRWARARGSAARASALSMPPSARRSATSRSSRRAPCSTAWSAWPRGAAHWPRGLRCARRWRRATAGRCTALCSRAARRCRGGWPQ